MVLDMGTGYLSFLQNIWPFNLRNLDDLKISDGLVRKLSIPDHTKQFVFAIQEPESESIIYILVSQNLSRQSALDAECLIKEIQPEAVVAQVASSALTEIQAEEKSELGDDDSDYDLNSSVPTSAFGVLKECFVNKINKDKYESLAGSEVMKEIFGIGFYGHFLAAKKAAKEVGSSILLLESPFVSTDNGVEDDSGGEASTGMSKLQALGLGSSSLVPQKLGSVVSGSSKRLCLTDDVHSQMVRSLASSIALSASKVSSVTEGELEDCKPRCDYDVPSYAQCVYSLLTDLHDIFPNLPAIGRALGHAQKMLHNVEKGETTDTKLLSEVRAFRIAVEAMRIGRNGAGRCPSSKLGSQSSSQPGFSELPTEDKSYALFAKALRSQTKKFKSIVAIVDASSLAGLRKHWNTSVPPEVEALIEQFFTEQGEENMDSENADRKGSIAKKSAVAVGAGATAVLGASSLSKVGPASTFMKVVAYKVPASLKLSLTQTYKAIAFAFSKTVGPSKVVVHGLGSSGAKTTSMMKATASAEKIRAVAHSVIASAERSSFSAMRTAFYEIMRRRRVQPIRAMPLVTFGCSMATCAGLLMYGDGIECVAESVPVAPRIASLGRGLQSLHQASHAVPDGTKLPEAIDFLMYTSNEIKVN